MTRLIVTNIGQLATPLPRSGPAAGAEQSALSVISDAAVFVENGKIICCGESARVMREAEVAGGCDHVLDAGGRAVIPGFVDCHTHLVYAGNRVDEYDRRLRGVPYLDIQIGRASCRERV